MRLADEVAAAIALALLIALGAAGAAQAEKEIDGNLVVSFDGGITPKSLPRKGTAPVTVKVDSGFGTVDGSDPPPQLRQISIGINKGGKIFDRGLPTCQVRRIQPSTIAAAKRICGGAIVGNGHVQVRVELANQPPFTSRGRCSSSTRTRSGGHRRLLAQVYGSKPPSAFVLNFKIVEKKGHLRHGDQDDAAEGGAPVGLRHPLRHEAAPGLRVQGPQAQLHQRRLRRAAPASPAPSTPSPGPTSASPAAHRSQTTLIRDCTVR